MTPSLSYHRTIAVLDLGSDENRFSPDWMEAVNTHLDAAQAQAQGLLTAGSGKFYSNGLDLDWLGACRRAAERRLRQT